MKIQGPWGLITNPSHSILCENEEEKKALIEYINEKYEKYEIKYEVLEVPKQLQEYYGEKNYYYEITGPLGFNPEKIIEWYNKYKGGENNMHETFD